MSQEREASICKRLENVGSNKKTFMKNTNRGRNNFSDCRTKM